MEPCSRSRRAGGPSPRGAALAARLTPAHLEALAPECRALLPQLGGRAWSDDFYLAGSAALALYLGHRQVSALDLMSLSNRLAPQERRDLLADLLAMAPGTRVETARDGYLALTLPGAIALRFYYYPYPVIEPLEPFQGDAVAVASPVDLGLMKLGAIISRGSRRDFVDLHLLCRVLPLDELLQRAAEKFGHVADFPLQAMKGLADTAAAAGEPMPPLAFELRWEEVESWITAEVQAAGRELLATT
ncbi:MAG: nucleotidyl transferase AbiEii/AbiGii toxin family protein [Thermoanaerobaculia bacterium]